MSVPHHTDMSDVVANIGDWVCELVVSAKDAAEKALLQITTLVEQNDEQLICEVTSGAYGVIELTDQSTWIVHGTPNFVHGFLFGCVSIGLTTSNEHFIGISGKGCFLMENPRKGSSSQKELTSFVQEAEVTSVGWWISLDLVVCGVPRGSLDISFHLGCPGCWKVMDAVLVKEAEDVIFDSEVALLCYPFAYSM
ncbi:hypothetical protein K1719_030447 [Acacia pycnantha]|nr:hypothetical protein K1719_030447 [Acacia pycnantha]